MRAIIYFISILMLTVFLSDSYSQDKMQDALTVIHNRKSVRSFTGQGVTKEELDKILRAGMAAPTAVNKQPWSFIAVTDRKTLNALKDGLPYAKMLDKAGAAIIVMCNS